jgi:hypothetical protein
MNLTERQGWVFKENLHVHRRRHARRALDDPEVVHGAACATALATGWCLCMLHAAAPGGCGRIFFYAIAFDHLQVDAYMMCASSMQRQGSCVARPARTYAASLHARGGDSGAKDAAERRNLRAGL